MFHAQFTRRLRWLTAGLLLAALPVLADDAEGVVRISDSQPAELVTARAQSPDACVTGDCVGGTGGSHGYGNGIGGHGGHGLFGHNYGVCPNCGRNIRWNSVRNEYVCGCNRGGLFHHHSGPGYPIVGHYSVAYPVDPGYFDQRDGNVYAAPGYGGPVSIPLAPVVNYQYNYGWGIPSSRLTPISHPAAYAPVGAVPLGSAPVARY